MDDDRERMGGWRTIGRATSVQLELSSYFRGGSEVAKKGGGKKALSIKGGEEKKGDSKEKQPKPRRIPDDDLRRRSVHCVTIPVFCLRQKEGKMIQRKEEVSRKRGGERRTPLSTLLAGKKFQENFIYDQEQQTLKF